MEVTFPTGSGSAATSSSPRAIARIAIGIDYPDFKASVEQRQGWMRHDIYATVWSTLRTLSQLDRQSEDDGCLSTARSGGDPGPVR